MLNIASTFNISGDQVFELNLKEAIVTPRNIDIKNNDGYAFNFAFIAAIYIIDQLGKDAKSSLASLMSYSHLHKIQALKNFFPAYFGSMIIPRETVYNIKDKKFEVIETSGHAENCIVVGDDPAHHQGLDSFVFFILSCFSVPETEEQRQNYLSAFTKEKFEELCIALLQGDTDVDLPIPSVNGNPTEVRRIRTPKAPDSSSMLYKVLTYLTTHIKEIAESTPDPLNGLFSMATQHANENKENNVKWRIIAIIAASVLVSGFGFFMSFTSYIAFSAINIVAPLIATLGLAVAIALPVGIAIKERCDCSCCNKPDKQYGEQIINLITKRTHNEDIDTMH